MSFHASEKSFDPLLLLSLSFIHDGTRSSLVGCDTFRVLTEPINLFLSPPWKREFLLVKRPMKAANVRSSYSSLFLSFLTLFPLFDEVCFASVPLVYTRRFQRIVEDWFERVRSSMIFESVYFNNWVGLSFFLIRWNKKKGRIRLDLSRGRRRTIFLFEEGMETEKVEEIVRGKWRQSNDRETITRGFKDGPKVLKSFGFRENFRDGQKPRKLGLTHSKLSRFAALPRLSSFPVPITVRITFGNNFKLHVCPDLDQSFRQTCHAPLRNVSTGQNSIPKEEEEEERGGENVFDCEKPASRAFTLRFLLYFAVVKRHFLYLKYSFSKN